MRFQFENLGLLDTADLEISDLTIICGENNTGKTYATYGTYGFLRSWRSNLRNILKKDKSISRYFQNKSAFQINLKDIFSGRINYFLQEISKSYIEDLPLAFASSPQLFSKTKIKVETEEKYDISDYEYEKIFRPSNGMFISLIKSKGSEILDVLFTEDSIPEEFVGELVIDAIINIVFYKYLPNVHIASVERTGAAVFRSELDFARTSFLRALRQNTASKLSSKFLLKDLNNKSTYSWPVEDNVDFARSLELLDKSQGLLCEGNKDILDAFSKIIGGSYKVVNEQVVFQTNERKDLSFSMNQASSSARALVDIGFYLRSKATPGDLLIIDEPELSLHPKSQRALARLLARLVNSGIKIFITTHSDYIIKELNTLIMLNKKTKYTENIKNNYGYSNEELIDPEYTKLYITEKYISGNKSTITLRNIPIDSQYGIEVETFDQEINLMNEIQEQLIYGE